MEQGYQSAKLAGLSILGSLKRELGTLDKVTAWLQVRVMVNAVDGFTQTTDVANGFSDLILSLYGSEIGMHARSAIGVQALPLGLPVIIDAFGRNIDCSIVKSILIVAKKDSEKAEIFRRSSPT